MNAASTEADNDDGRLTSPARQTCLFGHKAAEEALLQAMRSGRMHHAWLVIGPQGIGKATLAFRCARFMLSAPPGQPLAAYAEAAEDLSVAADNPVFHRIAAGSHGDLLLIERGYHEKKQRERTELPVEQVRRIAPFLHATSSEGGWRIVIVDGAETMNRASQNAILKVLEEPPPRSILFMLSANPDWLLPTIRSRCRRLILEPLSDAEMGEALASLSDGRISESELSHLLALAGGAPGEALSLWQGEVVGLWQDIQAALDPRTPAARQSVAMALASDPVRWRQFGNLLRLWLRMRAGQMPVSQLDPLMRLWDKTAVQLEQAETRNLDRRLVALQVLENCSRLAS